MTHKEIKVPVIDIFAGPGGLGEGFIQAGFNILLSAEMDSTACATLTLRKFFHCFPKGNAPEAYYRCIRGEISTADLRDEYPQEWQAASNSIANVELGTDSGNQTLYQMIDQKLNGNRNFVLIGGPP